jgi:hypothetical protein
VHLKVSIGIVLMFLLLLIPTVTNSDDIDYINKNIDRIDKNIDTINTKISGDLATKGDIDNLVEQIKGLRTELKEHKDAGIISDKEYGVAIAELKVRLGLIGFAASTAGTSGVLGIRSLVIRRRNGNGKKNGGGCK